MSYAVRRIVLACSISAGSSRHLTAKPNHCVVTASHPTAADCAKNSRIGGGQSRQRDRATVPSCLGTMCAFPDRRFASAPLGLASQAPACRRPVNPAGLLLCLVHLSPSRRPTPSHPAPAHSKRVIWACYSIMVNGQPKRSRAASETRKGPFLSLARFVFVHYFSSRASAGGSLDGRLGLDEWRDRSCSIRARRCLEFSALQALVSPQDHGYHLGDL